MAANYVPDESPLFSLQVIIFLLYPHMAERGEGRRERSLKSLPLLLRALIPS